MNAKVHTNLITGPCLVPSPPAQEGRVQKIVELVGCGAAYTIRVLARQFSLSPSHLQRLFKQETGVCLGEWLSEQRLQRAAHLLQHSYLSIKEITHTVGYEHASSFTRAFERRFRHAPTLYRKHGWGHSTPAAPASLGPAPSGVSKE
jgi:transcriptional regulator GlxA family with amidase domain